MESDFSKLIEKLRRVEALHARTDVAGERNAAGRAMNAIRARLAEFEQQDPPVEYRFSMPDAWSRQLFTALLRRYGLEPFRYRGQRYTTVMVRVCKTFVDETLWPEFVELDDLLKTYLSDVTDRVIREAVYEGNSSATERVKPYIEDQRNPK